MPARPTSNRRQFLQGRAAAEALTGAVDRILPGLGESALSNAAAAAHSTAAGPPRTASDDRYLVQYSRPAMACEFAVFLNAGQYEAGAEAAISALDEVDAWEDRLTVYRDTSEIMRVNRLAATRSVPLERRLFGLLSMAARLSAETAGAMDITAGPLVKVWGFYRRAGAIPAADELRAALANVGSRHLVLDDEQHTVQFAQPGLELNLGAIGKGFALDRAAGVLAAAGVADALLHGGQSSVLARGSQGDTGRGWTVGLRNPLRPEQRLAEVYLRDRALATSGASHQFFRYQGKRYGHILDPRTGWPAEGIFSATAIAPTAAEADALSTAFYVLGVDRSLDYCARNPEVAAILLYPGKGGSSVEVAIAGLSDGDWKMDTG